MVATKHDVFGDARSVTDEILRTTTMTYDAMGRLLSATRPGSLVDSYSYDLLGQRIAHSNSLLGTTNVERTDYDMQGRVVSQIAFGGDSTTTSHVWDGSIATTGLGAFGGWIRTTTYANNKTLVEKSDLFGREVHKTDLGGNAFTTSYDKAGRLTSRIASTNETLTYAWLNTGLASTVSSSAGTVSTYGYDAAGNRLTEDTVNGATVLQDATAVYDALGRMTSWTEAGSATAPAATASYHYDASGNIRRSVLEYRSLQGDGSAATPEIDQDYWYAFDSMNRVVVAKGTLSGTAGASGTVIVRGAIGTGYQFDKAGQRVSSVHRKSLTKTELFWFDANGVPQYPVSYDPEGGAGWTQGQHTSGYVGDQREDYAYTASGQVDEVRIANSDLVYGPQGYQVTAPPSTGALKGSYDHDSMGRLTRQTDWLGNGTDAGYDRVISYNAKGQVTVETVNTKQTSGIFKSITTNDYGSGTSYALGAAVSVTVDNYKDDVDSAVADTLTTTVHGWRDGAVTASTSHDSDTGSSSNTLFTSSYNYGGMGQLGSISIADGRPRTVTFTNDLNGQAIRRDEADGNTSADDPHEVWYRFAGREIGYTGNNATLHTDYGDSIANRTRAQGTGAFRFGAATASGHQDFDQSLAPINSYEQGGAGGSYTVRGGETLSSIAAQLWGDPSLWYKIAEANGMSAANALHEGQTLILPAGVMKNSHNASTFRPYDPSEVIGEASPTTPKPPKNNRCGMMGQIMLVAIAVAVTALSQGALTGPLSGLLGSTGGSIAAGAAAGAAGSLASQAVGVATGLQDRFDWKGVGIAAISGGVGGGVGKTLSMTEALGSKALAGALRGVAANVAMQGVSVATGLQAKFDFAGLAVAATVAGAVSWTNRAVAKAGAGGLFGSTYANRVSLGNVVNQVVSGMAGAISGAVTRTVLAGTSFGDGIMAALPDVIGQTIGNSVSGALSTQPTAPPPIEPAPEAVEGSQLYDGPIEWFRELLWGEDVNDDGHVAGRDPPHFIVTGYRFFLSATDTLLSIFRPESTPAVDRSSRITTAINSADARRLRHVLNPDPMHRLTLGHFAEQFGGPRQPFGQQVLRNAPTSRWSSIIGAGRYELQQARHRSEILSSLGVPGAGISALDMVFSPVVAAVGAAARPLWPDRSDNIGVRLRQSALDRPGFSIDNYPTNSMRRAAFSELVLGGAGGLGRGLVTRVSRQIAAPGPTRTFLTSNDFATLPARGVVNPSTVRFSQDSADHMFRPPFGSVDDFAADLAAGRIDPMSVDPIRLVHRNGGVYTLDNRRLFAFQQANIDIPYVRLDATPRRQLFKFTTTNEGVSIHIRR